MRIVIAASSLALLAACGPGSAFDNSFRESYVEKGVETCVAAARRQNAAGDAAVNYRRLCTCMMERHIQGKSATELMTEPEQQAGAAGEREMEQCINESVARGEISPAAATPAAPSAPAAGDGSKPTN